MTGSFYGLAIETLVAILLGLTIGYCFILNRRLIRLRADESALRGTIAELVTATEFAERAIKNLREITQETNLTLGEGLRASINVTRELDDQIARGEEVLDRIVQIAGVAQAARQPEREPEPANVEQFAPEESRSRSASRTAQAAQALVMRLRAATGQAA
ncbi:MAG: chemotaxis protein [Xanthobacteraceae bacterium]|nr:chemotaxis protein [Xanthobacteraceae bacterium]